MRTVSISQLVSLVPSRCACITKLTIPAVERLLEKFSPSGEVTPVEGPTEPSSYETSPVSCIYYSLVVPYGT